MKFHVEITEPAEEMLKELRAHGKKTLMQLRDVIAGLANDPHRQTEPLRGFLSGYRSLHAGRFRVIVKICDRTVTVYVVGVGFHASGQRRDVYELVQRALATGKIKPR